MTTHLCTQPIDPVVLMDYWLGALPSGQEDAVEQHLMVCDHCGDRLRETASLADGLRGVATSGELFVVVPDSFVQHAIASGQHVRGYSAQPGDQVSCTVAADDDLLYAHLEAPLPSTGRIDVIWYDDAGHELQRCADVAVPRDSGGVICVQSMIFAKASPTSTRIARLIATDAGGEARVLGEYTFNHTRTIDGPPGWTEA